MQNIDANEKITDLFMLKKLNAIVLHVKKSKISRSLSFVRAMKNYFFFGLKSNEAKNLRKKKSHVIFHYSS
jgi:hypothetical protein